MLTNSYIEQIVREPTEWHKLCSTQDDFCIPYRVPSNHEIRKGISAHELYCFLLALEPFIAKRLKQHFNDSSLKPATNEDSDFVFLAKLGQSGVNWKKNCAKCQIQTIRGTTDGLSDSRTVILRPCGHSLCKFPCAEAAVGAKSLDHCPLCKAQIYSTFIAELAPATVQL